MTWGQGGSLRLTLYNSFICDSMPVSGAFGTHSKDAGGIRVVRGNCDDSTHDSLRLMYADGCVLQPRVCATLQNAKLTPA